MIPDYQTLLLPLLKFVGDGKEHTKSELVSYLGNFFGLSEEELHEQLPNSKMGKRKFANRIHWAMAHLKMAGLTEYVGKERIKPTERGKQLLAEIPATLDIRSLKNRYKDYNQKILATNAGSKAAESKEDFPKEDLPPIEQIERAFGSLRTSLKDDLLDQLKKIHPAKFEEIVVKLLVKMGYGGSDQEAAKATRYTNDEGIDGIINEDKLGLDVIYIQAKRWEGNVSRPEIQKFVGALAGRKARKGVFITTASFTKEAEVYASQTEAKIVLIDGTRLVEYMIDHSLCVSVKHTFEVKEIDFDCFKEE